MTTFNEAVQASEAAHGIVLAALDKAFVALITAAGVTATKVSVDLRDRRATGQALVDGAWVPLRINLGAEVASVTVDNATYAVRSPELVTQVYKVDSMLTHAQALLDAVHEGLLSDDE